MPSAGVRLFVYGSLKRDGRHHDELIGARFLGLAETEPGYQLEQLGEYLALVPVPGGVKGREIATDAPTVNGELFEVDAALLPALDAFEGDAYRRAEVRVRVLLPPGDSQTQQQFADGAFALAYLKKAS